MSILGKMTVGFRNILVVNSEKKCQFVLEVLMFSLCMLLAETPILKFFFFVFVANGHHFQKC